LVGCCQSSFSSCVKPAAAAETHLSVHHQSKRAKLKLASSNVLGLVPAAVRANGANKRLESGDVV
jgi:hypothetical protein